MKGRNNANLLGIDAELLGQAVFETGHVLAALPHGQLAVSPGAARRKQLDRVVMLGRRLITRIDLDVGRIERRVDIAKARVFMLLVDGGDRHNSAPGLSKEAEGASAA